MIGNNNKKIPPELEMFRAVDAAKRARVDSGEQVEGPGVLAGRIIGNIHDIRRDLITLVRVLTPGQKKRIDEMQEEVSGALSQLQIYLSEIVKSGRSSFSAEEDS